LPSSLINNYTQSTIFAEHFLFHQRLFFAFLSLLQHIQLSKNVETQRALHGYSLVVNGGVTSDDYRACGRQARQRGV
jgi:hypothetical protein